MSCKDAQPSLEVITNHWRKSIKKSKILISLLIQSSVKQRLKKGELIKMLEEKEEK